MLFGKFMIFIVRKGRFKKYNKINFQVQLHISTNKHVIKTYAIK